MPPPLRGYNFWESTSEKTLLTHANHCASDHFKHLHDVCLVRSSEVSRGAAVSGHCDQLDDRFLRVLFSGSREPDRLLRVQTGAVEDHPGGDYAGRVFSFLRVVPETAGALESRGGLRDDRGCGGRDLQAV